MTALNKINHLVIYGHGSDLHLSLDMHDLNFNQCCDLNFIQIEQGRVRASNAFSIQCLNEWNTNNHRGSVPIFFPSRVIIVQRRMLIRRISIPVSGTLVIWILLISPLLHSSCDNDLRMTGHTRRSSFLSYTPCFTHTHPHHPHSVSLLPVVPALHW